MSDNPKNDNEVDWPSEMTFSGAIATMHPSGPTDFGIGKNIASFNDSIGGCNMDFKATAKRGYAFKADDARDIEYKGLMKVSGISQGFSISFCTGHHTSSNCCQGFAYMLTTEVNDSPSSFRFRKETVHVEYTDSPEGSFTHSKCNFKINGVGRYVGLGACRYNKPSSGGTSPQDDTVILEAWFNPDPDNDPSDWTMIKRIEDKPGKGWTGSKNKCNGDSDQIGPWSGAQNRMKTNATSGSIQFKSVTLREIDAFGSFDTPPPPVTCPAGQHPDANGNCVPDGTGGGTGGGGTGGGGGTPPPVSYVYEYKFGTHGSGNGQFLNPHDVSFDAAGNCFVCDRDRNDVQKFTHTGTYISKFGSSGSGNGQFSVPYAIQHTPDYANIYVMDRDNNRIQKLDASGNYVSKITSANGTNLNAPEDICFDGLGHFYFCDTGNNRVVEMDMSHAFIREWGSKGSANGQFDHPHSMDMGLDGNVYVNSGNQAYIQVFSPTGTFLRKFSKPGTHDGELLTFLEHLDIDLHGRLHIINNNARPIVSVFDCATGNFITKYGSPEKEGSANGQFREPEHVTTDATGKPFVVDSSNFRIQVFSVIEPPPVDPGGGGTGGGGGGGTPSEPSKVKGFFTLYRDINIYRTDACEGTGGGGGGVGGGGDPGGGSSTFYSLDITDIDADKEISNHSGSPTDNRTRVTEKITSSSSAMKGKILKQLDVYIKKHGTPGATPTIKAKIWNSSSTVMYTSPTEIDPTTLTTSYTIQSFDFSANTYVLQLNDRVGVEYLGTSDTNYVTVGYKSVSSAGDERQSQFDGGAWDDKSTRDFVCTMWQ